MYGGIMDLFSIGFCFVKLGGIVLGRFDEIVMNL